MSAAIRDHMGMLKDGLWLDRASELSKVCEAIRSRRSLLILGPASAGRTARLARALACLKPQAAEGVRPGDFNHWLRAQSSSRLKGALYRAADAGKYLLVLDHAPALTAAEAKVLKELALMRATPVYFLARPEDERSIALVSDVYWNPAWRLRLGPLPERAARELLEAAIRLHRLERFELRGFRPQVLRLSGRLPGAILEMCALAADRRYHYGERIKTSVLYVDFRTAGSLRPGSCRGGSMTRPPFSSLVPGLWGPMTPPGS